MTDEATTKRELSPAKGKSVEEPPKSKQKIEADATETQENNTEATQNIKPDDSETPARDTEPSADTKAESEPKALRLTYQPGDIFAAPPNSVLIHACNTQGSWGSGIAAAFKPKYPKAYQLYHEHCVQTHDPKNDPVPTGTCLLIEPSETNASSPKHYIGCLFTSAKYGNAKDKPDVIVSNTGPAVRHLLEQVKALEEEGKEVGPLRMCKINSGRFGVPWKRTEEVLEGIETEEGWRSDAEVWG